MRLALEVSRQALPLCRPNPPVGCVLVKNGELQATGFTHPPGEFHAEAHALSCYREKYQSDYSGVTAFVTLEPCSFVGKTPACAQALVDSGIRKIHVAMLDPDPKNSGRGISILKAEGIEVSIGLCEAEVQAFLEPWLIRA